VLRDALYKKLDCLTGLETLRLGSGIVKTARNKNVGTILNIIFTTCITASGSGFHQLLAASKKRRKSPNLLPSKQQERPFY
jgi:hypothetical protein